MFFFLGPLLSTSLYGVFSLLAVSLTCHINVVAMFQATLNASSFIDIFYSYMIWAPVAYVLLSLLHYLIVRITGNADSFFTELLATFVASFSNPWRGFVSLANASKTIDTFDLYGLYCWIQVIVHFVWSVGLFGFIGYGFYLIVH